MSTVAAYSHSRRGSISQLFGRIVDRSGLVAAPERADARSMPSGDVLCREGAPKTHEAAGGHIQFIALHG